MAFFKDKLPEMNVKATARKKQPIMNDLYKTAHERGFMKAAAEIGLTKGQSIDLYKQAVLSDMGMDNMLEGSIPSALMGGAGGAIGGGALGYMGGMNKQNPQEDHRYRDAILGALLGGGLGAGVGAGSGMSNAYNTGTNHIPGTQPGPGSGIGKLLSGSPFGQSTPGAPRK